MNTVIAPHPPDEGEWECQCARCGSSTSFMRCENCQGDGDLSLYEEDPLFYDKFDTEQCDICRGHGGWNRCLSGPEWCQAHPLEGRENVEFGEIEWFVSPRSEK